MVNAFQRRLRRSTKRFRPREHCRILQRVEFHYTPKYGSWLDMAEIEIAMLERNALSRRLEGAALLGSSRRAMLATSLSGFIL